MTGIMTAATTISWNMKRQRKLPLPLQQHYGIFVILVLVHYLAHVVSAQDAAACAEWSGASCGWEPNLRAMDVDFGIPKDHAHYTPEPTFYAYVTPDVATFYNQSAGSVTPAREDVFAGMFGKFINLSPDTVHVFWISKKNQRQNSLYISSVPPFDASGTATYVGHNFYVTQDPQGTGKVLAEWTMQRGNSLYYYDPFQFNVQTANKMLNDPHQRALYSMQLKNKVFAEQYKMFTGGTDWLALYQQKAAPRWHMWRADALGQTHEIVTKEIHFTKLPDADELQRGTSVYGPRPDERERVRRLRARNATLSLTLKVLSCAPRVFEIRNFLSDTEVDHIVTLGKNRNLKRSTMSAGGASSSVTNDDTRTSTNDWIPRHQDLILDAIYARAADVLQMNESLLRWRRTTEIPELTESHVTIAERLQLVHYNVGQQYTPHHDFAMPGLVNGQPSRFATMLFYLNDDMEGGETSFPRWLHGAHDENGSSGSNGALKVKPERGKAVLFYNLLPDGNYDERSQHAALPVTQGEKWLTNLWVWDPIMDHTKEGALTPN